LPSGLAASILLLVVNIFIGPNRANLVGDRNEFAGSILFYFLGHDGDPCEAAIKLQPENITINTTPEEPVSPSIPLDDEEEKAFAEIPDRNLPCLVPLALPNTEGANGLASITVSGFQNDLEFQNANF
jgi:hypothetical protein